jgi:hypothetical protein
MRTFQASFLVFAMAAVATVRSSGDDGPGDPDFSPNDGELVTF